VKLCILFPLVFDVVFDDLLICILTDCVEVIATGPEMIQDKVFIMTFVDMIAHTRLFYHSRC